MSTMSPKTALRTSKLKTIYQRHRENVVLVTVPQSQWTPPDSVFQVGIKLSASPLSVEKTSLERKRRGIKNQGVKKSFKVRKIKVSIRVWFKNIQRGEDNKDHETEWNLAVVGREVVRIFFCSGQIVWKYDPLLCTHTHTHTRTHIYLLRGFSRKGKIKGQSLLLLQLRSIMMMKLRVPANKHLLDLYLPHWSVSKQRLQHFTVVLMSVHLLLHRLAHSFHGHCVSPRSHIDMDITSGMVPDVYLWLNGCYVGKRMSHSTLPLFPLPSTL